MPVLSDRILRWLAWLLVGVYFLLAGAAILWLLAVPASWLFGEPISVFIIQLVVIGIYPVTGALIINRHPRHPVGWLLYATFPVLPVVLLAIGYADYATSTDSGPLPIPGVIYIWLAGIAQPIALAAFTWINLLFPTGRLLSPRWRIAGWGSAVALPVVLVLQILWPGPLTLFPELDNPYGMAGPLWATLVLVYFLSYTILLLCSLASVLSLLLRLRRSRGDEHQQVKWLVLPAFIFWLSQPAAPFVTYYGLSGVVALADSVSNLLGSISAPFIVIAVAFAIFRYRLYDIDVIIRRTLVYGALTATLALAYFSSVVVLQELFVAVSGQESAIAIVISTLVIAALFTPLRRRIQNDIDRRFYRRKYDAEKIVAAFGAGLREEVDIEQLSEQLLAVVEETLQPESLSLWLKEK